MSQNFVCESPNNQEAVEVTEVTPTSSTGVYTPDSVENNAGWIHDMEKKYAKIRRHIKQTCKNSPQNKEMSIILRANIDKLPNHFMVDSRHGLAYCRHGKVCINDEERLHDSVIF